MTEPLKTLTSQQAARRVGVSYPMLMRWVRAGLIKPPGYAGRQWAAVEWTEREIERARLVLSLKNLGLPARVIAGVFEAYGDLFDAGYKPFWIAEKMNTQGKRMGRALVLVPKPPSLDSIPQAPAGPGGKAQASGKALVIQDAVHVPLEGIAKTRKRNTKGHRRGK